MCVCVCAYNIQTISVGTHARLQGEKLGGLYCAMCILPTQNVFLQVEKNFQNITPFKKLTLLKNVSYVINIY